MQYDERQKRRGADRLRFHDNVCVIRSCVDDVFMTSLEILSPPTRTVRTNSGRNIEEGRMVAAHNNKKVNERFELRIFSATRENREMRCCGVHLDGRQGNNQLRLWDHQAETILLLAAFYYSTLSISTNRSTHFAFLFG